MSLTRLKKFIKSSNNKIQLALGEFQMFKQLGEGGNGIVYEASINECIVAIKLLVTETTGNTREQKIKRFIAEYFNIITISDASDIVKYIGFDKLILSDNDGNVEVPVIIMKRYDSSLLAKKQTPKSVEEFISLFKFLIRVTGKIHRAGIIHRDIKPENILLEQSRFALADFGIASFNPEIFKIKAETHKNERVGNRLFSAPEQERSSIDAHPTMDIYAIGQVLQWYATTHTHRGTNRQRITTIFPELAIYDSIIDKCLNQNPANRFQSIIEIENFVKNSQQKDKFWLLDLFNRVCRSRFPKNEMGVVRCSDRTRIDLFLQKLKDHEAHFGKSLWWLNGSKHFDFKLTHKENGIWKFNDNEYDITDIWVHYDSDTYNDFVLFKYQKGIPFEFEGNKLYDAYIVDGVHTISSSEANNGYAEISGEIIELAQHNVELIDRQNEDGYFFVGIKGHCIEQVKNEEAIRKLLALLTHLQAVPSLDVLIEFERALRKHIDEEVLMNR